MVVVIAAAFHLCPVILPAQLLQLHCVPAYQSITFLMSWRYITNRSIIHQADQETGVIIHNSSARQINM
jgi:hypothetical protein